MARRSNPLLFTEAGMKITGIKFTRRDFSNWWRRQKKTASPEACGIAECIFKNLKELEVRPHPLTRQIVIEQVSALNAALTTKQ